MKNKSKLDRIKAGNLRQSSSYLGEWLYFAAKEVGIKDIAEVFARERTELWEEAGVAVIALSDGMTVDFEKADRNTADEATLSYLEKNQVKAVFLVTIVPESFAEAQIVMEQIMENLGGFFCGDTPDFTPVIKKNENA